MDEVTAQQQPADETGDGGTLEVLGAIPSLAKAFGRGVLSRKGGAAPLPRTTLRVPGVEVDRRRLSDYQRLCGWAVSDTLPHTYPHVLGFPMQAELMSRPAFPLALMGLVHVENTVTVHRRLTADDRLDLTVYAERLRPHAKGRVVDLVTEVDVDGIRVWEGRSTYLARGKGDPDAPRDSDVPQPPTGAPAAVWRLPGDLGRRYGAVSGDINPIHLHPLTARALGFPRAIAHGMWTYARVLAHLGARVDGPSTSHVGFRKPVLLPGTVELVLAPAPDGTVALLRAPGRRGAEHLLLSHERQPTEG